MEQTLLVASERVCRTNIKFHNCCYSGRFGRIDRDNEAHYWAKPEIVRLTKCFSRQYQPDVSREGERVSVRPRHMSKAVD
jgi:hypothetical protein